MPMTTAEKEELYQAIFEYIKAVQGGKPSPNTGPLALTDKGYGTASTDVQALLHRVRLDVNVACTPHDWHWTAGTKSRAHFTLIDPTGAVVDEYYIPWAVQQLGTEAMAAFRQDIVDSARRLSRR